MTGPITAALERWRGGDLAAQFDLERALLPYLRELIELVRRQLDDPLRARIDSHAVVNDALKSFLSGVPKGEFPALSNHEEVRRLLRAIVLRALKDEVRFHRRQRRNPYRERGGAEALAALPDRKERATAADALAGEHAAWLEKFLAVVRPVHRKAIEIVKLRLEGRSKVEIKEELGLGLRTVQEIIKKVRQAWEAET
jgi:DNA-directed RNA polymerase specialized sigma24 family protein